VLAGKDACEMAAALELFGGHGLPLEFIKLVESLDDFGVFCFSHLRRLSGNDDPGVQGVR